MTGQENKIFITLKKKNELKKELDFLMDEGRHRIAKELDNAKALGDLKENAEYHQAREDQGKMEARILEIENILKHGELIKKTSSGLIEVGSEVVISKKNSSTRIEYKIVGEQESDIFSGKIAFSSPIASSMIGKKIGEFFEFQKPSGEVQIFKIISIK